jgi:hypothetical protein
MSKKSPINNETLTARGWEGILVAPEWMSFMDVDTDKKDLELIYLSPNKSVTLRICGANDILIKPRHSSCVIYRGGCNSLKFFDELIPQLRT